MAIELPDGRCESDDVLEALRRRAVPARERGYAVVAIAAILGVREETVSRWCSRFEHGGPESLPGARTGEGGEIHGGDETGVRSTCQHSRGSARPGETPELLVPGS